MPRLTRRFVRLTLAAALAAVPARHVPMAAQTTTLGTFRWQLQPFCNAITVTVTARGGTFAIDGFDDQCGAAQRAPLTGQAAPNPDGTIGLGLHVVTVPGGRGVDIAARVSLATLGGPWTDSAGHTGTLAFNASTGGSPRPAPTVSAAALAPGAIGSTHLNLAQVQARMAGTCAKGQVMVGVAPGGAIRCSLVTLVPQAGSTTATGLSPAIAIGADGLPLLAYSGLASNLQVMHCGTATCSAGNTVGTADQDVNPVGNEPSMAVGADGLVVIAHGARPFSGPAVRVTHCGNLQCNSGNVSQFVSLRGSDFPSLAIGSDGFPVVSHYNDTSRSLHVVHCTTVTCSGADEVVQLDGTLNDVGSYNAIAVGADGLPIISYRHASAGAVRVAHCGNRSCTAGNTFTTVDAAAGPFGDTSMAIGADGLPVISYYADATQALRVLHCGNATCTTGNVATTVDDLAGIVGRENALRIGADGLPIIAHVNYTTQRLRVSHCRDVACTVADSSDLAPAQAFNGSRPAMAIDGGGIPTLFHYSPVGLALTVTRCGTPTCQ